MLRRLLISVLLLWLPLQALAAVTMPFCRHTQDARVMQPSQEQAHAAHHVHAQHDHAAPVHPGADPGAPHGAIDCNDCGSCHLACAPAVLSRIVISEMVLANAGPDPLPCLAPLTFVPDQPNPPPLLRG